MGPDKIDPLQQLRSSNGIVGVSSMTDCLLLAESRRGHQMVDDDYDTDALISCHSR